MFLKHMHHTHIGSFSSHLSGSLDSGLETRCTAEHFLSSLKNPSISGLEMILEIISCNLLIQCIFFPVKITCKLICPVPD